jgi:predicted DNA-binding protein (MmcQ/YjbR family)
MLKKSCWMAKGFGWIITKTETQKSMKEKVQKGWEVWAMFWPRGSLSLKCFCGRSWCWEGWRTDGESAWIISFLGRTNTSWTELEDKHEPPITFRTFLPIFHTQMNLQPSIFLLSFAWFNITLKETLPQKKLHQLQDLQDGKLKETRNFLVWKFKFPWEKTWNMQKRSLDTKVYAGKFKIQARVNSKLDAKCRVKCKSTFKPRPLCLNSQLISVNDSARGCKRPRRCFRMSKNR